MDKKPKAWYVRKLFLVPALTILGFVGLASINDETTSTPAVENIQTIAPRSQQYTPPTNGPEVEKQTVQKAPSSETNLSNSNYYTNVGGNQVHSPAYADSVPAGASARCRDGTYSFSQNRRGTCSHHGGVASWL